MADEKGQHEPSMEEILASIRRIIAEDETPQAEADATAAAAPGAPGAAAAEPELPEAASDDVLELTEVVEEEQAVANSAEAPAPNGAEPDLKLAPEPSHDDAAAEERERLISAASAAASVAALSQLVARPRDKSAELPLGEINRTLEDMVRELIKPMLKTWIDENLPSLVERLVREEISRLVREAESR